MGIGRTEQLFTQLLDPSCGSSDLPFSDAHTQEWAIGIHLQSEGTVLLDAVIGTEESIMWNKIMAIRIY